MLAGSVVGEGCFLLPRWHLIASSSGKEEGCVFNIVEDRRAREPNAA
jgi:hypothetical protein